MSISKFTEKMKQKAAESKVNGKDSNHTFSINLTDEVSEQVARIARATDMPTARVLVDFIKSHATELKDLAESVEKIAPKDRLKRPLYRSYQRRPSMKSIASFVDGKKK